MDVKINEFIAVIEQSIKDNTFIKLNLGDYKGTEEGLKKVIIQKAMIKKQEHLSFVYRYQTKDITKNDSFEPAIERLHNLIGQDNFRFAQLYTLDFDIILQRSKSGGFILKKTKASLSEQPTLEHNKIKNRKIAPAGKTYLHELKITDAQGNVRHQGQDKYKQINHYIEILSSLLKELPRKTLTNIVDMGSGKGYLTFALYDYLNNTLKLPSKITGVEYRKDLVDLCNGIAQHSNFDKLNFVQGSIQDYQPTDKINVLIALHACDTATDDAIYKGISDESDLIVVAPCCHKQIRREIEKHKVINDLDFITKHGIFMERQAEMITDSLRALYLEYAGYATKVFEFISDAHTPKNVLIVGEKRKKPLNNQKVILEKIAAGKKYFGIEEHYLGTLLKL